MTLGFMILARTKGWVEKMAPWYSWSKKYVIPKKQTKQTKTKQKQKQKKKKKKTVCHFKNKPDF